MRLWFLFFPLILFLSCVSNKKVILLQKKDVNISDLPKDTILRTYAVDTFQYKVQPNDVLSIRFQSLSNAAFDFFSSNTSAQLLNINPTAVAFAGELVDERGEIPFPVIGKVKVAGLTIFEIQEMLKSIASEYVESPIVKVRLLNFRITVLGEVNREGTVVLVNNRVSMLEAIGLAGGLGELADRENIKLIRQRGGRTEVQYINLLEEDFFNSPNYYVYQNDVLIVPPLNQRPFRRYFGTNLSLVVSTISLLLLALNLTTR